MTQDTYRFAYEEANAELSEIRGQFEQLQLRRNLVEQAIEALRPVLSDAPAAAITHTISFEMPPSEPLPFLVQQVQQVQQAQQAQQSVAVEPLVEQSVPQPVMETYAEPQYAQESSDPFQRRIDNALRQGFGGRDSRVMSLGLNGLLTRA
ncbi:MAG TPA: hypothetical protein VE291_10865 [Terracidiphilus sp.]|jgi:hypothetical protein|nr:hypothetical protein [Terracidiphilus sp.]